MNDEPVIRTEENLTPELKARWLEALRSGRYQQGRGALLHRGDGDEEYCCLGVLGYLCGASKGMLEGNQVLDDVKLEDILGSWTPDRKGQFPFDPTRPETHISAQRRLAALNDTGKSFSEIADYIEANL